MTIKIKPSRKGTFTRWAKSQGKTKNGKITAKAITAGKKSRSRSERQNPAIRKKAVFAQNARKWAKRRGK